MCQILYISLFPPADICNLVAPGLLHRWCHLAKVEHPHLLALKTSLTVYLFIYKKLLSTHGDITITLSSTSVKIVNWLNCNYYWAQLPTTFASLVMHSPRSIRLYPLFYSDWPLTLIFCMWVAPGHGSQGIKGQGLGWCGRYDLDWGWFVFW